MKEVCINCGGKLPPLNGNEENDFASRCEVCSDEHFTDDELDYGPAGREESVKEHFNKSAAPRAKESE